MANRVQVELGAKVEGFVEGMNQASESAKKYETDQRKVKESLGNFRKEFAQAKKDVMNLAAAYSKLDATAKSSQFGKEMAKQLEAAKQKASEMLDMQGDLNQELKNMASDTRVFDTLSESMGVFMNATASALGVVAQFTGNEEDARKAVVAFTTAQSVLQTVTKVQNALQKQSNTMLAIAAVQNKAAAAAATIKAAAEGKGAIATKAATVAQAAFNAVAKANPYILLATAIIGVATALGTYMYASRKARDEEEKHQKQIETIQTYYNKFNEQLGSTIPTFTRLCTEWKTLRTEAEKVQWIKNNQTEFNNLGISVNSVTEAENVFVKNTNAVVKSLMLRAQAAANAALAQKEWEEVLQENARLEKLRGRKDLDPNEIKGVDKSNVKHESRGWISELYSVDVDRQQKANIERGKKQMQKYIDDQVKLEKESGKTLKTAGIKSAQEAANAKAKATKKGAEKVKKEIIKNSVEEAEAELQARKDKLKKIDVNDKSADLLKTKLLKEISYWQKELDKRKLQVGLELAKGAKEALDEYEKQLKTQEDEAAAALMIAQLHNKDYKEIVKLTEQWEKAKKKREDYEAIKKNTLGGAEVKGKEFKTEGNAGSLQEAQDKVQWYKAKISTEVVGTPDYNYLLKKLKEWESKEEEIRLKVEADLSDVKKGSLKWIQDKKAYWEGVLQMSVAGSDEFKQAQKEIKDLTKEEKKIMLKLDFDGMDTIEKIETAFDGLRVVDDVVSSISNLTNAIEEDANAWEIFMAAVSAAESIVAAINAVTTISNMLSGISAAKKTAEAAASTAATTAVAAEAAAEGTAIAPAVAMTAANKALEASYLSLASSMIFAAHASIPFVGVGLAAGFITSMLAIQAAANATAASLGAFAEGGIVNGSSYHGDRIVARVNSGEMILNQRQQKNLFDLLDQDVMPQKGGANVTVTGIVRGTDLLLVQKNTNKVRSKAGTQISF